MSDVRDASHAVRDAAHAAQVARANAAEARCLRAENRIQQLEGLASVDQAVTACCVLIRACSQRLLDEGDEFDPLIARTLDAVADQIAAGDWREHLATERSRAEPVTAEDWRELEERVAEKDRSEAKAWGRYRELKAVARAAVEAWERSNSTCPNTVTVAMQTLKIETTSPVRPDAPARGSE